MSTKNKKKSATGVRYSAEQKKAVVDFVLDHNSSKGRGGQTAAAKKFKMSPITINSWVKSTGKSAKSKAAPKQASKAAPKNEPVAFGIGARGARYNSSQKAQVVDFVNDHNAANGRGGQSAAAKKFGLSVLTVSAWLKSPYISGSKGISSKAVNVPAGLNAKFASLIEVSDQLRKTEGEVARLRAKYDALRAAIQALI